VFLEIGDETDEQDLDTEAELTLTWLPRGGVAPGQSRVLIEAVAAFTLPPGRGRAYTIGQTSVIRAVRQGLLARGMQKDQIGAEGYWRPDRTGGHDHIDD